MIDNGLLRQALVERERHAPSEADVLAGFRAGVMTRQRRRQAATVVGVAGAASVVAVGVFVAAGRPGEQRGPAQAPPGATSSSSSVVPVPPAAPALPFSVGFLPAGYQLDAWQVGPAEGSAQYFGGKDFETIVVWISAEPRDAVKGASDEPTTVAGRSAVLRRLAPDRAETQLIWQLADGRWAMVGGRAPTVSLQTLRSVAEQLSPAPTPLRARLGIAAMPEGYLVHSWHGGGSQATGSLTLCRSAGAVRAGEPSEDCIHVNLVEGTAPASLGEKSRANVEQVIQVPLDQEQVVNGVLTRATADGRNVVAQLDPGHWVQAFSVKADVGLLRELASTAFVR